jgi:hypothetical protein
LLSFIDKTTKNGRILLDKAKPFNISKQLAWEAYRQVKANRGAAGVDGQTIDQFEEDLKANLYICHCVSDAQVKWLQGALEKRLAECGLELHPQKTKIVHCHNDRRPGNDHEGKFDFLGFTFRFRSARSKRGGFFTGFLPAVSNKAAKKIRQTVRSWKLHRLSDKSLEDFAYMFNPVIRGWINYYGSYYKSALYPVFQHLENILSRWAVRKYKRLRNCRQRARHWLRTIAKRQPGLLAHWTLLH